MKHMTYTFTTKDGKQYSAKAGNRFEAQTHLEVSFGIDLTGAIFEEIYKLRTIRSGIVR